MQYLDFCFNSSDPLTQGNRRYIKDSCRSLTPVRQKRATGFGMTPPLLSREERAHDGNVTAERRMPG